MTADLVDLVGELPTMVAVDRPISALHRTVVFGYIRATFRLA